MSAHLFMINYRTTNVPKTGKMPLSVSDHKWRVFICKIQADDHFSKLIESVVELIDEIKTIASNWMLSLTIKTRKWWRCWPNLKNPAARSRGKYSSSFSLSSFIISSLSNIVEDWIKVFGYEFWLASFVSLVFKKNIRVMVIYWFEKLILVQGIMKHQIVIRKKTMNKILNGQNIYQQLKKFLNYIVLKPMD